MEENLEQQIVNSNFGQQAMRNLKQMLSSDFTEKDGKYIFKEKGKPPLICPKDDVKDSLDYLINLIITFYNKNKNTRNLLTLILFGARIKVRFDFEEIDKKVIDQIEVTKEQDKRKFDKVIKTIFSEDFNNNEESNSFINQYMEYNGMTSIEAVHIITKYVQKELFEENKDEFADLFFIDKDSTEGLLEHGFINEDDIRNYINRFSKNALFQSFENRQKNILFWLKYIDPTLILEMFSQNIIDKKIINKYVSIERLASSGIDKNLIMKLLKERAFDSKGEMDLWNLYESNYFSEDELDTIVKMGYINPNHIIEKYNQAQKRNIAVALDEISSISMESLVNFLSPQRIINLENSNRFDKYNTESKQFVRSHLRDLYTMYGRDLELELLNEQKQKNEMQEDKSKQKPLIDLYKSGLVSLSKFEEGDISSEEIVEYYRQNKNVDILIEANNIEILSNLDLVDLLEDFEEIFDLIKKGLNPTILNEFCGVQDILELYKTEKVSTQNLSKLTINKDSVRDLYVSEKIEYEDLDTLYRIGLITIEERNQIEQEYDIESKLEILRKTGILGKDSSELQGPDYGNIVIGNEFAKPTSKMSKEEKILSDAKIELFKRLGASDPVNVKCDLFKDYIMHPIIDERLAIFEGKNGATYIFPLKVVLEQVGKDLNYIKEKDIIGQAENRRQLYNNKALVRRVFHTNNWGPQLIQKMQELNPSIDAKQLREECQDLTEDIRAYYNICKEPNVIGDGVI